MNNSIYVEIFDPCTETTFKKNIHQFMPTAGGLLARTVLEGFNVFRPWKEDRWYYNVTSSTRFNIETEGMTPDEMTVFIKERKP